MSVLRIMPIMLGVAVFLLFMSGCSKKNTGENAGPGVTPANTTSPSRAGNSGTATQPSTESTSGEASTGTTAVPLPPGTNAAKPLPTPPTPRVMTEGGGDPRKVAPRTTPPAGGAPVGPSGHPTSVPGQPPASTQ